MVVVFNSLSTWLLFFWADYLLARLDRSNDKKVIPTPQVSILRIVWFIRGLLSIYTILCSIVYRSNVSSTNFIGHR